MGNKLNNNIGSIVFLVVFYSLPHSFRFDCLFFHCVTLMCDEWTVSPFKYPSAPSQKEEERKKHGTEENLFPCLVCRFAKKDRRKRERDGPVRRLKSILLSLFFPPILSQPMQLHHPRLRSLWIFIRRAIIRVVNSMHFYPPLFFSAYNSRRRRFPNPDAYDPLAAACLKSSCCCPVAARAGPYKLWLLLPHLHGDFSLSLLF